MNQTAMQFGQTLACSTILLTFFATTTPTFAAQGAVPPPPTERIDQLTSNSLGERLAEARRQSQLLSIKRSLVNNAELSLSRIGRDAGDVSNGAAAKGKIDPLLEVIMKDLKQLDVAVKAHDIEQRKSSSVSATPSVAAQPTAVPEAVDMAAKATEPDERVSRLEQKLDRLVNALDFPKFPRTSVENLTPIEKLERGIASTLEQLIHIVSGSMGKQDDRRQSLERDLDSLESQMAAISSMAMSSSLGNAIPIAASPFAFGLAQQRSFPEAAPSRSLPQQIPYSAGEWLPPLSESCSTDFATHFPQLSLLHRFVERRGFSTEANRVEEVVAAVKDETSKSVLLSPQKMSADDHPIGRRIKSAREAIDGLKTKIDTEEEVLRKRTAETETEFLRRDSDLNQNQINIYLVNAVYMMIFSITLAIICLFAVVFVYKDGEFPRWILKDRVLIELLSMGFLLLTIIILGTAKILEAQGLSALLGTISGYIFIRKASEMAGTGNERSPTGSTPIDVSSNKIQITAIVVAGKVQVGFTSGPIDGVNIYSRLKGAPSWKLLARCTKSPYEDGRPLANAGVSEDREYFAYGVIEHKESGQPSNVVSVKLEP